MFFGVFMQKGNLFTMVYLFKLLTNNKDISKLAHSTYKVTGSSFPVSLGEDNHIYPGDNFFYREGRGRRGPSLLRKNNKKSFVLKKKIKILRSLKGLRAPFKNIFKPLALKPLSRLSANPLKKKLKKKRSRVLSLEIKRPLRGYKVLPSKKTFSFKNFLKKFLKTHGKGGHSIRHGMGGRWWPLKDKKKTPKKPPQIPLKVVPNPPKRIIILKVNKKYQLPVKPVPQPLPILAPKPLKTTIATSFKKGSTITIYLKRSLLNKGRAKNGSMCKVFLRTLKSPKGAKLKTSPLNKRKLRFYRALFSFRPLRAVNKAPRGLKRIGSQNFNRPFVRFFKNLRPRIRTKGPLTFKVIKKNKFKLKVKSLGLRKLDLLELKLKKLALKKLSKLFKRRLKKNKNRKQKSPSLRLRAKSGGGSLGALFPRIRHLNSIKNNHPRFLKPVSNFAWGGLGFSTPKQNLLAILNLLYQQPLLNYSLKYCRLSRRVRKILKNKYRYSKYYFIIAPYKRRLFTLHL